MRHFDQGRWPDRLGSPAFVLGVALAASLALASLPDVWTAPLRDAAATALRPGLGAAGFVRRQARGAVGSVRRQFNTAAKLARAEREIERLRAECRHWRHEAEQLAAGLPLRDRHDPGNAQRLLRGRAIPARVLGAQARAFLARHDLLGVGARAGVEPEAWVVEPSPAVIDRGADGGVEQGDRVLAGARVWGRVVEVGSHTAVVIRATEAGYRDVVRLAAPLEPGQRPRLGAEGVLEGTGERLARLRMVPVSEPVDAGDLVIASDADVLSRPLIYGRVARVERPVGAAHWEIWVEPAAGDGVPDEVAVVRIEMNPLRVAGRQGGGGSR